MLFSLSFQQYKRKFIFESFRVFLNDFAMSENAAFTPLMGNCNHLTKHFGSFAQNFFQDMFTIKESSANKV